MPIEKYKAAAPQHNPPHPGKILRIAMGKLTVSALAEHLSITRTNMSMILNGRMSITPAIALKLSEAFPNQDAEFWLNLQSRYSLATERHKKRRPLKPVKVPMALEEDAELVVA